MLEGFGTYSVIPIGTTTIISLRDVKAEPQDFDQIGLDAIDKGIVPINKS